MSTGSYPKTIVLALALLAVSALPARSEEGTLTVTLYGPFSRALQAWRGRSPSLRVAGSAGGYSLALSTGYRLAEGSAGLRWRKRLTRRLIVRRPQREGVVLFRCYIGHDRWRHHCGRCWDDWPPPGWEPPLRQVNVYNRYIIINDAQAPRREDNYEVLEPNEPEPVEEPGACYASLLSPGLGGDEKVDDSFALGEERLSRRRFSDAVQHFSRVLLREPGDPVALLALGIAHLGQNDWEDAAHALREGLARHPDPGCIRLDLRPWLGGTEGYGERVLAIHGLLQQTPSDPDPPFLLGFLCFAEGDWSAAVSYFEQAEALDRTDQSSARMRAIALGRALEESAAPEPDLQGAASPDRTPGQEDAAAQPPTAQPQPGR